MLRACLLVFAACHAAPLEPQPATPVRSGRIDLPVIATADSDDIPDVEDRCPDPEDIELEIDGCPEPEVDPVLDDVDRCPGDEPGVNVDDRDSCP